MEDLKTFYLKNGKKLTNVKNLANELKSMSNDVYEHHVNPLKNDFSNWVKNSIKDIDLAKKIDGHINKIEMELEILRHLIYNKPKVVVKKKSLVNKTTKKNNLTKK